jgi:hypothetical protein
MRAFILSTPVTRRLALVAAVGSLVASVACAASPSAPSAAAGATSVDSAVTLCADQVNQYRAKVGLGPVTRASDLEDFAAHAAEHDARLGVPHQYFLSNNGGGVSKAENQLLLWKGYAIDDVITQGMATMWAEGAGGSHYQVLTGNYTQVGCGVFISGGEVSVSQDFR